MRYSEIEDSWENLNECREELGDRGSRFYDSQPQQRGRTKKLREKLNLWEKIGRQYYTHGISEYPWV
jgi:hypothetical protein